MLFGHILMFFHFLGHPRLLGTLQAFMHVISRPKTFANSYVLGKVKHFQGRSVGTFLKYRGFKVVWAIMPPTVLPSSVKFHHRVIKLYRFCKSEASYRFSQHL